MANRVRTLLLTDDQRAVLLRQVRRRGSPARMVERARIVLLAAEGLPARETAERVGCSGPTVIRWRSRFADGLAGLADEPRSGKPPTIPPVVRDEILAITLAGTVPEPIIEPTPGRSGISSSSARVSASTSAAFGARRIATVRTAASAPTIAVMITTLAVRLDRTTATAVAVLVGTVDSDSPQCVHRSARLASPHLWWR